MNTFADAEAVLADALPGYEPREPQRRLAEGVERLLDKPEHFSPYEGPEEDYPEWERPDLVHFLGQAGTGVGKSLGYLIPVLLSGKRAVVSVTTKALQNQLALKDLPFLQEHLGINFSWSVLKGRSNYLCVNRLALVTQNDVPELPRITALMQDPNFDGERETIARHLGRDLSGGTWNLICADTDECSDNGCEPINCYAERARDLAKRASVVIANHALFFTDLMVKSWGKGGMLGEYEMVVFDEAHEMEEVAGNTLGGQISEGAFTGLHAQIRRWAREHADDEGEALTEPLNTNAGAVYALFQKLEDGRLTEGKIGEAVEEFAALYDSIAAVRTAMRTTKMEHAKDYEKASKRKKSLYRMLWSLADRLEQVIAGDQTQVVRWVETERTKKGEPRKVIKIAPILVAPFLHKWLFTKVPCVLVSATLIVKQSFDHISSRLGIPVYEGIDVGTPFDYPTQGRIYVPLNIPTPQGSDQSEWQAIANIEISRLLKASNGRALVLFTSVAHMREAATVLPISNPDLDFRKQYDAPTNQLTEWLKDHDPGQRGRVLLAVKSFFTGVDIPGEALSLVIITKMPFPTPNDALVQARCEAIDAAGGNSFRDYTVPVMSLVLKQAAGRLIRHRDDKGVVAILDPRIASKGYGRTVLADLPPMGRVYELDQIEDFLRASA